MVALGLPPRTGVTHTVPPASAFPPISRRLSASLRSGARPLMAAKPSSLVPALVPAMTYDPTATPGTPSPIVHSMFDKATSTWTYVVADPETRQAMVIDTVLDFDPASGKIGYGSVQGLHAFLAANNYSVASIVETHVHADHLTGAYALKNILPEHPPITISDKVRDTQRTFASVYGYDAAELSGAFDQLVSDGEESTLGSLPVRYMALPGHTPESMGILVGDSLFAGDSIFMPDIGTARVDFPGGSAQTLYASIQRIFALDPATRVFSGHDYPSGGREALCMVQVREHAERNKHVGAGASEAAFVKQREDRDATLGAPRMLHASLQVNLRGGRLPPAEHGRYFLKTPLQFPSE